MEEKLIYDFDLTDKVSNILSSDFWVLNEFSYSMVPAIFNPVKFTSNVSVYIKEGSADVDLDLLSYHVEAPAVVTIRSGQILQIKGLSKDFQSSFIVMSKRFVSNLCLLLQDCRSFGASTRNQAVAIDKSLIPKFDRFYKNVDDIFKDKENPYGYQAMTLAISSFFFEIAYRTFSPLTENASKGSNRIPDKFIALVQQNFKKERFLDFYAEKLEITPKHLSRTMKNLTGFTAVEWIERYVVLEAKVMLKSTNLSIQQISDELNFPSQSFFGKYFKKNVGVSPKEFRNS